MNDILNHKQNKFRDLNTSDLEEKYSFFLNKKHTILVLFPLGRSGISFLHGLLDNNDTISNSPYIQDYENIMIYHSQVEFINIKQINSAITHYKRNLIKFNIDIDYFEDIFRYLIKYREQKVLGIDMFKLFYFTLMIINKQNTDNINYLLAHQHIVDPSGIAENFYSRFDDVKFIFTVKDMRKQAKSTIRHIDRDILNNELDYYMLGLKMTREAYEFYKKNKSQSYVVINEELNGNPEITISKLLNFLGLEYSIKYLSCTNQDKLWGAFPSTNKKLNGNEFSSKHVESYNDIDSNAVKYIELLCGSMLLDFNYELKYIKTKFDYIKYSYLLITYNFKQSFSYKKKNISVKNKVINYIQYIKAKYYLAIKSIELFKRLG